METLIPEIQSLMHRMREIKEIQTYRSITLMKRCELMERLITILLNSSSEVCSLCDTMMNDIEESDVYSDTEYYSDTLSRVKHICQTS
jgi:hypothetical protein